MDVCMCVYVCNVPVYVNVYMYWYVYVCICMQCICLCIYMYIYMYICMDLCMCVYVCNVSVYVFLCLCILCVCGWQLRTCSVECVKMHKARLDCSGLRDKTAFVPLAQFNDSHMLSGISLSYVHVSVTEELQFLMFILRYWAQFWFNTFKCPKIYVWMECFVIRFLILFFPVYECGSFPSPNWFYKWIYVH